MPTVDTCIWMVSRQARRHPQEFCKGSVVHNICILSSGDLPTVYSNAHRPTFFFNKYFMERDHVIMDCMEERIVKQNRLEYENDCLNWRLLCKLFYWSSQQLKSVHVQCCNSYVKSSSLVTGQLYLLCSIPQLWVCIGGDHVILRSCVDSLVPSQI